jgi:hypothetical protein
MTKTIILVFQLPLIDGSVRRVMLNSHFARKFLNSNLPSPNSSNPISCWNSSFDEAKLLRWAASDRKSSENESSPKPELLNDSSLDEKNSSL